MTIEEMRARKKELGYTYEQIAELAHLPVGTVQKVLGGITKAPRYDTRLALERVLLPKSVFEYVCQEENSELFSQIARDAMAAYQVKKPGDFTVEDYLALPDDERVELIDGVFYDMASPTVVHQIISGQMYIQLNVFIKKNRGQCIPAIAPLDVQLDCDNKTMVQPDVLIVCDRNKFRHGRIYGAPDFLVEVLLPSTKRKDMTKKVQKYADAGVREYWIVDPDKKKILVYYFEDDDMPMLYGFDSIVPVNIYQGECVIDFKEIFSYIEFLYDRTDE